MLQAHATVNKVVRRGAKVIAVMAAASRECAEELVAQGARGVLEAIAVDPEISAKAQTVALETLAELAFAY